MAGAGRVLVEIIDWFDVKGRVEFVVDVERRGFSGVTIAEVAYPDTLVVLGLAAAATQRLTLEPAVVQCGVRTAPSMAGSAATLQEVSDGRFRLGIGVSSEAIVSGWHGQPWHPPLAHARECLDVLRIALSGEKTRYSGHVVSSTGFQLPDGERSVPLHLAALNAGMLRLAAERADGVWLNYLPRSAAAKVTSMIDAAAADAQRESPTKLLTCLIDVTDDPDASRRQLRELLAFYMASPAYRRAFAWHGFETEMAEAGASFERRDRAGVLACITDELIDSISLVGSPVEVRDRFEQYFEAGIDEIAVAPLSRANLDASLSVAVSAQA